MTRYRPNSGLTPAVQVILIINVAIFLLINFVGPQMNIDFVRYLGLHLPTSKLFNPLQYITHMFTQADLAHLFFNMFAVFMFGRILESVWGTKRFLFYYFVTGLGAALLHQGVSFYQLHQMQNEFALFQANPDPHYLMEFVENHVGNKQYIGRVTDMAEAWLRNPGTSEYLEAARTVYSSVIDSYTNIATIGASGAVFGLLLAFGMLFPNTELYIMFIPIPIKAKYFVLGYGAIELIMGLRNSVGDNVAHFAHLGGMIFGFFLIRYWRKHSRRFY